MNRVKLQKKKIFKAQVIRDSLFYNNEITIHKYFRTIEFEIIELDEKKQKIQFDVKNVDMSLANAFRRILISEIPTIAFEKIVIFQNTSILQDENLAHRLSLIPIICNPHLLEDAPLNCETELNQRNALVFTLHSKCINNSKVDLQVPKHLRLKNHIITSSDLKWICQQGQEIFKLNPPHPPSLVLHDGNKYDIPIVKLDKEQEIEIELYAVKNVGMEHAKWSPVSAAFYRLMPEIEFSKKFSLEDSKKLKKMCPMNVFDFESINGIITSKVTRPRACTMCRECIRDRDGWEVEKTSTISISRKRNHFIFFIESIGHYPVEQLFVEALSILQKKCRLNLEILRKIKKV